MLCFWLMSFWITSLKFSDGFSFPSPSPRFSWYCFIWPIPDILSTGIQNIRGCSPLTGLWSLFCCFIRIFPYPFLGIRQEKIDWWSWSAPVKQTGIKTSYGLSPVWIWAQVVSFLNWKWMVIERLRATLPNFTFSVQTGLPQNDSEYSQEDF